MSPRVQTVVDHLIPTAVGVLFGLVGWFGSMVFDSRDRLTTVEARYVSKDDLRSSENTGNQQLKELIKEVSEMKADVRELTATVKAMEKQ